MEKKLEQRLVHVFGGILLLAVAGATFACSPIAERPEEISIPKLKFEPQKPVTWTLKNGLQVFFQEHQELPLLKATLYVPGGSLFDADSTTGLASAVGSQLREGGAGDLPPSELDAKLAALGASIESDYGSEYGSVSLSALSEDADVVFSHFADIVKRPRFDESRLKLWKQLVLDGIKRRRDEPGLIARMIVEDALFGATDVYSEDISESSLQRITPGALRKFQKHYVRPNGSYLTISGALTKEAAENLVAKYFGDWEPVREPIPEVPEPSYEEGSAVYVVERDFTQATILMAQRGPSRFDASVFPMLIFNELFGHGGFASTLFAEVRTKLGLAYSVYGGFYPGTKIGTFQINLGTRVEKSLEAIDTIEQLVRDASETLPSAKRLDNAKDSVSRGFVFKFREPYSIVNRAVILKLLGYPEDYDAKYLDNVAGVTATDVRDVVSSWVAPSEFTTIIVGDIRAEDVKKHYGDSKKVYRVTFSTNVDSVVEVDGASVEK